jgi:tRNA threonylcarbamoyladenosine biosynthesis protein TsaB
MSCILNIETSTNVCSVSVSEDFRVVWNEEDHSGPNHSVSLGVFVEKALAEISNGGVKLDAVAVSWGPGSYTGLRIGLSTAKGVCYGSGAKLISVPTLKVLCVPVLLGKEIEDDALLCPMIDARRMEVYAAVYDRALREVRPVGADIVEADTYKEFLDSHPVYFFGNGADKCKDVITHPNARFIAGIEPLARNMHTLAERSFNEGNFEDVAYSTPFYLKEFHATVPKQLL